MDRYSVTAIWLIINLEAKNTILLSKL